MIFILLAFVLASEQFGANPELEVGQAWDGDFEEVPLLQHVDNMEDLDTYFDDEELVGDNWAEKMYDTYVADDDDEVQTGDDEALYDQLNEVETELKEAVGQPPEVLKKFGYGSNDGPVRPGKKNPSTRIFVEPTKQVKMKDVPPAIQKLLKPKKAAPVVVPKPKKKAEEQTPLQIFQHVAHNLNIMMKGQAAPPKKKKKKKKKQKRTKIKMKLPSKFTKYLNTLDTGKREKILEKLRKANKKDKKKFQALLANVVGASEAEMKAIKNKEKRYARRMKKDLKEEQKEEGAALNEMSKDKDRQIGEMKEKLAGMEGEENSIENKLKYSQKLLKEQGKNLKDKLKSEENKFKKWEGKFAAQENAKMQQLQNDQLQLHKDMSKEERELVMKLNALRSKKRKKRSRKQRYACNCQSEQCQGVCDRCNMCESDRCESVCNSGMGYKKQLAALKKQLKKLKKSWDKRSRDNQKALLKLLKKRLGKAKKKYKKNLTPKVVKIVKKKGISKAEKDALKAKAAKAKSAAAAEKLKKKAALEKQKLKELKLIFTQWLKRSQKRLERLLKKDKVKKSNKPKVVKVFRKYMDKATKTFGKWKGDAKKLGEYLSMTTKVWERKSRELLKKVRTKQAKEVKAKKVVVPKRDPKDMPYAERLFNEWKDASHTFLKTHLSAVMPEKRDGVTEHFNQLMEVTQKAYMAYLTKNWKVGSRVKRRRGWMQYLKKRSDELRNFTFIAIFGPNWAPSKTSTAADRKKTREVIFKSYRQFKAKAKAMAGKNKATCKGKVNKALASILAKAKAERNSAAKSAYKTSDNADERYVKYLVALGDQYKTKMAFFAKTCHASKGPRPYETRMYNMFKDKSGGFVKKNLKRMCKKKYVKAVKSYWASMKAKAHEKYLTFLNMEVKKADKIKKKYGAESEVSVGSWEENAFTRWLWKESKKLESYVRKYLRKCGYKIIKDKKGKKYSKKKKGRKAKKGKKRTKRRKKPKRAMAVGDSLDSSEDLDQNSMSGSVSLGRRRLITMEENL